MFATSSASQKLVKPSSFRLSQSLTPWRLKVWYARPLVCRPARLAAPLLLSIIAVAICGAVGAASGAENAKPADRSAAQLRAQNDTLTQRIHTATLDLFSLDAQVEQAHSRLLALSAERRRLERERASVRLRIDVTRDNARTADRRLAVLVHNLYEQEASDPLAMVLGAESLEEAITTLDDLNRSAQTHRQVAQISRRAKTSLGKLTRALAREDAHVRALEDAAARTEASLAQARDERTGLISELSAQRDLNDRQIAEIDAVASASAAASARAVVMATPPGSAAPQVARTVTVTATAYSAEGATASGLPAGWGTVAVDPSVIPLGTRLSIPGYGHGVAADTGSAVSGAAIDLWFPSRQQALAWGRRVVVVTLH
jgi:3D (Asp-Asp-Asp) domain-containing protein